MFFNKKLIIFSTSRSVNIQFFYLTWRKLRHVLKINNFRRISREKKTHQNKKKEHTIILYLMYVIFLNRPKKYQISGIKKTKINRRFWDVFYRIY